MYKTCSCQYNWIHLKLFGERLHFNVPAPLTGDRLEGRIHVQQLLQPILMCFPEEGIWFMYVAA